MTKFEISSYSLPSEGEFRSGDLVCTRKLTESKTVLLLADVAGHGNGAYRYAASIKNLVLKSNHSDPREIVYSIDALLRTKTHAAVLVGILDNRNAEFNYVHVGDIHGRFIASTAQNLVGQPGVTGAQIPSLQIKNLKFTPGASLFLFTDGVREAGDLDSPEVVIKLQDVARNLVEKYRRTHDDALCVIIRRN